MNVSSTSNGSLSIIRHYEKIIHTSLNISLLKQCIHKPLALSHPLSSKTVTRILRAGLRYAIIIVFPDNAISPLEKKHLRCAKRPLKSALAGLLHRLRVGSVIMDVDREMVQLSLSMLQLWDHDLE